MTIECNKCIYCLRDFGVKGVKHSKEHMFPKSFGCPDRLVLNCVCHECNQSFKKNEMWLARDSIEGVSRYLWKEIEADHGTNFRRLQMMIPYMPENGIFQGAYLYPSPEKHGSATYPVQIGLSITQDIRQYFTWTMLVGDHEYNKESRERVRSLQQNYLLFGDLNPVDKKYKELYRNVIRGSECPDDYQAAVSKLSLLGILHLKKPNSRHLPIPEYQEVLLTGNIDRDLQRVITKIAFNYAAYHFSPTIMLRPEFNKAREFILKGNGEVDFQPCGYAAQADLNQSVILFRIIMSEDGLFIGVSLNGYQQYKIRLSCEPYPPYEAPEECYCIGENPSTQRLNEPARNYFRCFL